MQRLPEGKSLFFFGSFIIVSASVHAPRVNESSLLEHFLVPTNVQIKPIPSERLSRLSEENDQKSTHIIFVDVDKLSLSHPETRRQARS